MRKPLVAGNWKMHGSRQQLDSLLGGLIDGLSDNATAEVLVCPAFVYLHEASARLGDSAIELGAQNVCAQAGEGAFTGEISAAMLADIKCRYVIVGHSERRAIYAESDEQVAKKFVAAQAAGLIPVLCVGETLDERESGATEAVVARQLDAVLDEAGVAAFSQSVLAYEPVWAIGTGKTASPDQAQQVHGFIRSKIAEKDVKIAGLLRILYGGSVKPGNAAEIFAMADVDGGLIGGASLKVDDFLAIVRAAG
ncbi:MAG: triose-phosphate isomerase [Gammaproteobacteria bacterium]|nr:triose-phosphate isomerase [Gammaproteobacteria bacterium]